MPAKKTTKTAKKSASAAKKNVVSKGHVCEYC